MSLSPMRTPSACSTSAALKAKLEQSKACQVSSVCEWNEIKAGRRHIDKTRRQRENKKVDHSTQRVTPRRGVSFHISQRRTDYKQAATKSVRYRRKVCRPSDQLVIERTAQESIRDLRRGLKAQGLGVAPPQRVNVCAGQQHYVFQAFWHKLGREEEPKF